MTRIIVVVLVGVISLTLLTTPASGRSRHLSVAFVTDIITTPGPHSLRGVGLLGFRRAVKDFHLRGRVVQYNPRQGQRATLESLGRQKYDLIFAGIPQTPKDYEAIAAVAASFPTSKFVSSVGPIQDFKIRPKNLLGWIEHSEQPAYLAGYLAALIEKRRPGKDVIGSVGGAPLPPVDSFIAGYEAGARKADPRITTLRTYAGFIDPAKCKVVARGQIAKGAGALFDVAGLCGSGTLQAAKERDVWGIGVDVDRAYLGPHILTSAVKHPDVGIYSTIETFLQGKLKTPGNHVGNLRNGGVGLGRISPKVPRAFVLQVERIRKQIIAGKIKVPSTLR
jgi:basic membrane protein A